MKFFHAAIVLFFSLTFENLYAQTDTMIVYTISSQTIDTVLPVTIDTATTSDQTGSFVGSLGNQTLLSLIPPASNLFLNSEFSDIARAELFFNVTDYPIRTATRLFYYRNDTLSGCCSGIMIAKDFVLTAGHCAFNYNSQIWGYDSILVAPAYDNGMMQPSIPTGMVDKVYLFKTFYDKKAFDDIALLQLKEPIGLETGWIGMAFNSDTTYYSDKVFHKLSYPAVVSPFDTNKIYNGDTLYYNYGFVDVLSLNVLGINSPEALAIPGQSGSSLFYTDNNDYLTYAVLNFSTKYRHYQITQEVFYQLENILNTYPISAPEVLTEDSAVSFFPNPFSVSAVLRTNYDLKNATLTVYNSLGQLVKQIENISGSAIVFSREHLNSGLYLMQLVQNGKLLTIIKIVVADN